MLSLPAYVLITPARNEASFIESTIRSVIAQTVLPAKWIIVSDGSTDGTDEIVARYAAEHSFIELVRAPERKERSFAGKVHAFNAGYARVREVSYSVIGCLDADISFDRDHMCFLLTKLAEDPALGLTGTPFQERSGESYDYRFVGLEHVSGACQLFRRECFEAIGGYIPVKGGAVDKIAVISARMKGWRTRTFTEKLCVHYRAMGTAQEGPLSARFRAGVKDYAIGNHPLWQLARTLYQMTKPPYVVGGLTLYWGYLWSLLRRAERPIPAELVAFHRGEQMRRLRNFILRHREYQERSLTSVSHV